MSKPKSSAKSEQEEGGLVPQGYPTPAAASAVLALRDWFKRWKPGDLCIVASPVPGPAPGEDEQACRRKVQDWHAKGRPEDGHPFSQDVWDEWRSNGAEAQRRHAAACKDCEEGSRLCRAVAAEAAGKPPHHQAPTLRLLAEKLETAVRAVGWPDGDEALRQAIHLLKDARREMDVIEDLLAQPPLCDDRHMGQAEKPQLAAFAVDTPKTTAAKSGFLFLMASKEYWHIAFGGQLKPIRTSKGMDYVHKLLSAPGVSIHVWTLRYGTAPPQENLETSIDAQTLVDLRKTLDAKHAEREAATDQQRRDDLEVEIKQTQSFLTAQTTGIGPARRPRRVRTESERVRESVGKAIALAIARITTEIPACGEHLAKWIDNRSGMQPRYSCPESDRPAWVLNAA
jgi:hypothetical protein